MSNLKFMDLIQKTKRRQKVYLFLEVLLLLFPCILFSCKSSTAGLGANLSEQNNPSLKDRLNAFVDISHHNVNVDLSTAQKAGLVGFFHKATQGATFVDDKYGERIQAGRALNLLMGAYHFGTGEDVEKQVNAFLTVIKKYGSQGVVPVLDWEKNSNAEEGTMSQEQASDFIKLFFQKTKVYPMVYGGYWMLEQLGREENVEYFSKTPLWQGFYSSAFGYLDGVWENWSFIQYTDGQLGPEPHQMAGIGPVDRNFFNGTLSGAKDFWSKNALKANI